jgi:hypothetical protein
MTGNEFWEHLLFSKCPPSNDLEKRRENVPLTDHEIELESIFFNMREQDAVPVVKVDLQDQEGEETGSTTVEDESRDDFFHPETEEEQVVALKKLSLVKKYAFIKLALQDMAKCGITLMGGRSLRKEEKRRKRCNEERSTSTTQFGTSRNKPQNDEIFCWQ